MPPRPLFVRRRIWSALPWRVRRQVERAVLASLRFLPAEDTLRVAEGDGEASLVAVGDMALSGEVEESYRRRGARAMAGGLFEILTSADLRVGNLETQFTAGNFPAGDERGIIKASPDMAQLLSEWRFDAVTVANNHALDYGEQGLKDSLKTLDARGIGHCGGGDSAGAARAPARMRVKDLTVGMLGYCDDYRAAGGDEQLATTRDEAILEDIGRLRAQVDLVILQIHWGYEFALYPFLSHRERARRFAEAGADLVLCHHAHVPMGLERWKGKLIAYGLGNLLFYRSNYLGQHPWSRRSFVLQVSFGKSGVHKARLIPCGITDECTIDALGDPARREVLGAVKALSGRLGDDEFLAAIEWDRTIREGLQMVENLALGANDGSDAAWALQLRTPRHRELLRDLKGAEISRPIGDLLESAAGAGGLNGAGLGEAARKAIARLRTEADLPHGDLPGRTPYT